MNKMMVIKRDHLAFLTFYDNHLSEDMYESGAETVERKTNFCLQYNDKKKKNNGKVKCRNLLS